MTTRALASATLQSSDATRPAGSTGTHPIVSAVASGLLLWSSFPPADWGWLAWIALTPLFLLARSTRSRGSTYLGAWLGGLAFWVLSIQWVRLTDPSAWLAWLVMATFLSLWWPAFLLLARLAVLQLRLPLMLAAPVVWVALEFARAFILSGFPWYYLAHSQYRYLPVIQIADVAGALGISALVATANACWAELLSRPLFTPTAHGPRLARPQAVRIGIVAVLLAATLGYGGYRLATARFRPGPKVALVQSNLDQKYKMTRPYEEIVAVYERLISRVTRSPQRPDLIVWPETSYPYGFVVLDPKLERKLIEAQIRSYDKPADTVEFWQDKMRDVADYLHSWSDRLKAPMLVGSITYEFRRAGLSRFNSAILFEPGRRTVQSYHKLHLVPFGEYVPLIESFPWLTALTPYHGDSVPSLAFGREPVWFDLNGRRFATAICFEDTVPHVVRRFFAEAKDGRQPDFLVNLSNDGWFHGSEELDMHLAVSVFRCVENRVPLARAVNTGVSALIDGNGRIESAMPKLTEGLLQGTLPLDDRTSLYSARGDWVGFGCSALAVGLIPMALGRALYLRLRKPARSASLPSLPHPR